MDDAVRRLGMRNHVLHKQSFNRPNLEYAIRKKGKKIVDEIGRFPLPPDEKGGEKCY